MDELKAIQAEADELAKKAHALRNPDIDEPNRPRTERQKAEALGDLSSALSALLARLIAELIRQIGGTEPACRPTND